MTQDLSPLAAGLILDADGVWRVRPSTRGTRASSRIDYPDEANAFCFAVEDGSFWFQHRNAVIVDTVRRFPPSGFIADIGAGNGYVSRGLTEAGFETIVLEPGPAGIRNAQSRGLRPLVCATLQDAGFRPASLPAAGMFDVVEHIDDDIGVLKTLNTALAPGGRVYLTVPAFQWLWSGEDDLVGHHRRYTIRSLEERLRATGFATDFSTYFFAPLPVPILLLRSLPWWMGQRKAVEPDKIATELQPRENAVVRTLRSLLAAERGLIQRGWRIPIGSSCMVVAVKKPRT